MGVTVTSLASIDPHRSAQEHSRLFALSGFFFRHVEASFDLTITELEQHAVPAIPAF